MGFVAYMPVAFKAVTNLMFDTVRVHAALNSYHTKSLVGRGIREGISREYVVVNNQYTDEHVVSERLGLGVVEEAARDEQ